MPFLPFAPAAIRGESLSMMRRLPQRYRLVVGTFFLSVLLYVDRICISVAKDEVAGDRKLQLDPYRTLAEEAGP